MAMAVLPVLRSPMISSRWPRPIGVMASIALMPVCIGSSTGWRSAMPGAVDSTSAAVRREDRPLVVDRHAQRVDHAADHGLADRDAEELAGGGDGLALVDARCIRPRMITPTDDSSRLNASPLTPFSNATISPVITPERPWTRAMPSPTSSTRPTSDRVTSAWNCSISF